MVGYIGVSLRLLRTGRPKYLTQTIQKQGFRKNVWKRKGIAVGCGMKRVSRFSKGACRRGVEIAEKLMDGEGVKLV